MFADPSVALLVALGLSPSPCCAYAACAPVLEG
jgi:hypothetical protein